ncbi:MAG TPA: caspase family protein [Kofleriaceae bacterium]|jgi:hypothetical protein
MTRQAHALLIAGDDPDHAGTPTAYAQDALSNIETDLRGRFAAPLIASLSRGATVDAVNVAFGGVRPQPGDLFVVMFAGHGGEASPTRPSQSWFLTAGQYFTDADLAARLLELPAGVDAVVISDCCYGEGFFRVGRAMFRGRSQGQVEHLLLRAQSRALPRVLGQRWYSAGRDSPMVCISAASKNDEVTGANLPDLAAKTAEAAVQRQSYSQLNARFASYTPAGGTYHIDARPGERMADLVLAA